MRDLIKKILREAADENIAQYCNSDPRIKKTLDLFIYWRTGSCSQSTLLDEKGINNEVNKNFTDPKTKKRLTIIKVKGLDGNDVEVNPEQYKEILRGRNKQREQQCGGSMFQETGKVYKSSDYCSQEILDEYFKDDVRKSFNRQGKDVLKDEVFGVTPLENCNVFYLNTCLTIPQKLQPKQTGKLPELQTPTNLKTSNSPQFSAGTQTNQDKFRKGVENVSQSVKGGVYSATNYLKGKSGN
jgi:hypothetical protein